jgi:mannose-6-phosphate isomerase-like protein (cupin superfamily)
MNCRDFLIAGDHARLIANDVCDFHYKATPHRLRVGDQTPAQRNEIAETHFMVREGIVEFMVGGAVATIPAGDFVRVPAGMTHACRNAGDAAATILVRTASPSPLHSATHVLTTFAT